jgi:hypothetical protein
MGRSYKLRLLTKICWMLKSLIFMAAERTTIPENADASFNIGWLRIMPDDYTLWGLAVNDTLELSGRMERFRTIMIEDGCVAEGIWTPQEAAEVAASCQFGEDGNIRPDPKLYISEGDGDRGSLTFCVNAEVIDLLVLNGTFKLKDGEQDQYRMDFPGAEDSDIVVEMRHKPSGDSEKEIVTLHVAFK